MIATSTRCLTSRCPIKEGQRVPPFGVSTASRASPGWVSPPAVIASAARLAPVQAAEEPSHKSGQRELAQDALAQYAARARYVYDRELLPNAHPPAWIIPQPHEVYKGHQAIGRCVLAGPAETVDAPMAGEVFQVPEIAWTRRAVFASSRRLPDREK